MKSKCDVCGAEFLSENDFVGLCAPCLLAGTVGERLTLQFEKSTGREEDQNKSAVFVEIGKLRSVFPELEIIEPIRSGGMGAVFKARQTNLGRHVALKILDPRLSESAEFQERFEREARTMARLSHSNIVTIHDFGERKGFHYLLMEYIEGCDLRDLICSGELSAGDALELVPQICDALAFAHECGVVHRDVKPGNILVDIDGNVKMTDFGLAKLIHEKSDVSLTVDGGGMGTPHYVAPEQFLDAKATDERSDIFALGVVVYEMLTGRIPSGNFPEPTASMAKRNRRLDQIVMRAMEQSPEKRFSSVKEFSDSLTDCIGIQKSTSVGKSARGRTFQTDLQFQILAGVVVLGILVVGFFSFTKQRAEPSDRPEEKGNKQAQVDLAAKPSEPVRRLVTALEGREGTLHGWSHGKRGFDISATEGIQDFVRIGRITRPNYPWIAYRKDTSVFSESSLLQGRNLIAATPTMFITGARMLAHGGVDSPNYLPLSKRWGSPVVDVVEAIAAGVMLTESGKVSLLARERWIETHPEIVAAVHAAENIVKVEMKEETAVLIAEDGSVVSWNGVLGLMPDPSGSPVIREAACGTNHAFGLTEEGEIVGWAHPNAASFTKKEFTAAAMAIPEDLERCIAIRAAKFVAAAQQEDFTWRAWGADFGTGLIKKINSLGPTGDLDFFLDTRGEGRLLWIEPEEDHQLQNTEKLEFR